MATSTLFRNGMREAALKARGNTAPIQAARRPERCRLLLNCRIWGDPLKVTVRCLSDMTFLAGIETMTGVLNVKGGSRCPGGKPVRERRLTL